LKRRGGSVSGPAGGYRGGALIVCRRNGIIPLGKMLLRSMGFLDVHGTTVSNNGLVFIINDLRPRIVFVEAGLYHDATPYRMEELMARLPGLKIAAFSLGNFRTPWRLNSNTVNCGGTSTLRTGLANSGGG
jgi:hypothetical protein